jgi:hypothetical protein
MKREHLVGLVACTAEGESTSGRSRKDEAAFVRFSVTRPGQAQRFACKIWYTNLDENHFYGGMDVPFSLCNSKVCQIFIADCEITHVLGHACSVCANESGLSLYCVVVGRVVQYVCRWETQLDSAVIIVGVGRVEREWEGCWLGNGNDRLARGVHIPHITRRQCPRGGVTRPCR